MLSAVARRLERERGDGRLSVKRAACVLKSIDHCVVMFDFASSQIAVVIGEGRRGKGANEGPQSRRCPQRRWSTVYMWQHASPSPKESYLYVLVPHRVFWPAVRVRGQLANLGLDVASTCQMWREIQALSASSFCSESWSTKGIQVRYE